MTQEQKDKLEQAAAYHQGSGLDFMAGAQNILENPNDWGLAYLKDLDRTIPRIAELNLEMYKEIEDMKSQLTKYRQALERIVKITAKNNTRVKAREIAKEALKQQ